MSHLSTPASVQDDDSAFLAGWQVLNSKCRVHGHYAGDETEEWYGVSVHYQGTGATCKTVHVVLTIEMYIS